MMFWWQKESKEKTTNLKNGVKHVKERKSELVGVFEEQ